MVNNNNKNILKIANIFQLHTWNNLNHFHLISSVSPLKDMYFFKIKFESIKISNLLNLIRFAYEENVLLSLTSVQYNYFFYHI